MEVAKGKFCGAFLKFVILIQFPGSPGLMRISKGARVGTDGQCGDYRYRNNRGTDPNTCLLNTKIRKNTIGKILRYS